MVEWTSVRVRGFVDPALIKWFQRKPREGVVTGGGHIEFDERDGVKITVSRDSRIEDGTRVHVKLKNGNLVCAPISELKTNDEPVANRSKTGDSKAKQDAEDFWDQYDIPFEYDVAIKGRRSGLLRGSSGTGRTRQTVMHLFVKEAFTDGRLSREADTYLCSNEAKFRFTEEGNTSDNTKSYTPSVTCQTCLERMKRWKTQ